MALSTLRFRVGLAVINASNVMVNGAGIVVLAHTGLSLWLHAASTLISASILLLLWRRVL